MRTFIVRALGALVAGLGLSLIIGSFHAAKASAALGHANDAPGVALLIGAVVLAIGWTVTFLQPRKAR